MSWFETGNKDTVNGTFEVKQTWGGCPTTNLSDTTWGSRDRTYEVGTGREFDRAEDGSWAPSLFQPA